MHTYKAILHGDRVEWIDRPPARNQALRIQITLVGEAEQAAEARGDAMAEALEALARGGGISTISTWQKEARQDRPLPPRGS